MLSIFSSAYWDKAIFYFIFVYLFIYFFRAALWHMKFPRLGVESELPPLAYATATAMPDLSHICKLHHSAW